ncbi:hypothetical protein QA640_44450 (plasmid) [Bradyrhizobium sp. CB82]|uniref:hypothetical protein n=1 Tax=Bradyrhizobium sp. CB82 TaxID=3039159 RepID=UPI0024B15B83|nr:hypothetical protein [Bradyrhizobium sp. CB82]WFU45865.1 hypothetical protein QA640_44450 [Bradyrhizobium sp. CB82]
MSFINWDATFHFDPHDPLNAFATHGIPVPTTAALATRQASSVPRRLSLRSSGPKHSPSIN